MTRMGVNIIRISTGSNSHLVLKKYSQSTDTVIKFSTDYIFCFSGHTERSFKTKLEQYVNFVQNIGEDDLSILNEQLSFERESYVLRLAIVAKNRIGLLNSLKRVLKEMSLTGTPILIKESPEEFLDPQQRVLLSRWINGEHITDEKVSFQSIPLSLPSYPFDRQSYWITEGFNTSVKKKLQLKPSRDSILDDLRESVSELLGHEINQIKTDQSLIHYGIDSLSAIKLLASFKGLSQELKPQDLFNLDSLEKLADEIVKRTVEYKKDEKERKLEFQEYTKYGLSMFETIYSDTLQWLATSSGERPLLLLPPLNTSYLGWVQQLKFISGMGYRLYIPIYPGHSENELKGGQLNLDENVDEINRFVKNELKCNSLPIFGWSIGGCICMKLADRYPQLVESMVLVSAASKFDQEIFRKTITLHEELEIHKSYLEIVLGNQEPIVKRISAGTKLSVLKYYYDFLESFDMSTRLATFEMPVLIVSGLKDSVITEYDIKLLKLIPKHELMILTDHGHFIPLTAARQFNDRIIDFVIKNEPKGVL